jgi:DNA-binding transcriptional ArsR family regulator
MCVRFNGDVTGPNRFDDPSSPELAAFAREVADPSRASMLVALMDGRAWTVGELAHQAGIAHNTASENVRRLVLARLVTEARQGRHCYLTLAGPQVAGAV